MECLFFEGYDYRRNLHLLTHSYPNRRSSNLVATARAFYSGPTTRDGKASYFGWLPGSEMPDTFGWSFLQTPINDQPPFGGLFKWVFGTDWDWKAFDFDRDMPAVHARLDPIVNEDRKSTRLNSSH